MLHVAQMCCPRRATEQHASCCATLIEIYDVLNDGLMMVVYVYEMDTCVYLTCIYTQQNGTSRHSNMCTWWKGS